MAHEIHELDTVRLLSEIDGAPAGTIGTVVSEYPETALIELADPSGERDLLDDLISVPYDQLALVERAVVAH